MVIVCELQFHWSAIASFSDFYSGFLKVGLLNLLKEFLMTLLTNQYFATIVKFALGLGSPSKTSSSRRMLKLYSRLYHLL